MNSSCKVLAFTRDLFSSEQGRTLAHRWVILIVTGVFSANWATSDDLTLQCRGWPEALRGNGAHRRFFHLLGIVLVVAGIIPFLRPL